MKNQHSGSRREFVKKAAYVAPAILTLQAAPAYVKAGSKEKRGRGQASPSNGESLTRSCGRNFPRPVCPPREAGFLIIRGSVCFSLFPALWVRRGYRTPSKPLLAHYSLSIFGARARIVSADPSLCAVIHANFGSMAAAIDDVSVDVEYSVATSDAPGLFSLVCREGPSIEGLNIGDLLFHIEKDLAVELQKRRPDLYFLHSAALEWKGKAYLFAAEAGSGKSTTTWALLHHGFRYLSDELSPIDPNTMQVFPYPHALCLKEPPPDYPLPPETVDLGRTLHVPVDSLPSEAVMSRCLWVPYSS